MEHDYDRIWLCNNIDNLSQASMVYNYMHRIRSTKAKVLLDNLTPEKNSVTIILLGILRSLGTSTCVREISGTKSFLIMVIEPLFFLFLCIVLIPSVFVDDFWWFSGLPSLWSIFVLAGYMSTNHIHLSILLPLPHYAGAYVSESNAVTTQRDMVVWYFIVAGIEAPCEPFRYNFEAVRQDRKGRHKGVCQCVKLSHEAIIDNSEETDELWNSASKSKESPVLSLLCVNYNAVFCWCLKNIPQVYNHGS